MQSARGISILVDDIPEKIARYKEKLRLAFPDVIVADEWKGPVAEVVTLLLKRRA